MNVMSTAELTCAGSKYVRSLAKPKRNVWSAARASDVPPPPLPQAAIRESAPNAIARKRNPEPARTGVSDCMPVLNLRNSPCSPLPGDSDPGRECADRRSYSKQDQPYTDSHMSTSVYALQLCR